LDYRNSLDEIDRNAANDTKFKFETNCKDFHVEVDPYISHVKQVEAYNAAIKDKRHAETLFKLNLIGLEKPNSLNLNKLNEISDDYRFRKKK